MIDSGKAIQKNRQGEGVYQTGWQIASVLEIPIWIDPSWFFVLVFATGVNSLHLAPRWGWLQGGIAGLAMALLLFVGVLLHELGHALAAKKQGIQVISISLFIFGGMAVIDRESKTPGAALEMAIAGPCVSLILFGLLQLLIPYLPSESLLQEVGTNLAIINLVLALFNLIPGLPLDGGQILKAAIWKATGNRFIGVRWAARAGEILGWLAIIGGIALESLTRESFSGFWLILLGWFGIRHARHYQRLTDLQETLIQLKTAQVMSCEYRVVNAKMTLQDFSETYLLTTPPRLTRTTLYFAASDGRYRGAILFEDFRQIDPHQWQNVTLEAIARPLETIPTVTESTPLLEVINLMENQNLTRLTVLSPAGAVAGSLDRGDIVRAVAKRLDLPFNELQIRRIKDEGHYPAGLQLGAIAKIIMDNG